MGVTIISVAAIIFIVSTLIFAILILNKKIDIEETEKQQLKDKLQETVETSNAQNAAAAAGKKIDEEYADEIQKAHGGNKLNNFDAINNILSK